MANIKSVIDVQHVDVCCMLCFTEYREDLAKPAQTLFLHNLTGILESAIRATNAQYDDADILRRLDVRLLEVILQPSVCLSVCLSVMLLFSAPWSVMCP